MGRYGLQVRSQKSPAVASYFSPDVGFPGEISGKLELVYMAAKERSELAVLGQKLPACINSDTECREIPGLPLLHVSFCSDDLLNGYTDIQVVFQSFFYVIL